MDIFSHYQQIDLTSDQHNALEQLQMFLESDKHVFILQGYAGSGKTTLLKGLIGYLNQLKKQFQVMAPTGRAAKILREKTGHGKTIHRGIYNFEELKTESKDDDHTLHYYFPIKENDNIGEILIVDESSMISSRESNNELFTFGTNILLNDLMTYSQIPNSKTKIIFVGDPAQLPPVGDSESKALEVEYFQKMGVKATSCVLKEVVRQSENLLLQNAFKFRSLIENKEINQIELDFDNYSFEKINSQDITAKYVALFPNPELEQSAIIAFSNAQCLAYNNAVRKKIFPNIKSITAGDILIVLNNNYHLYHTELLNGLQIKVMEASENIISRKNIPVYETINGKRIKKYITLDFREVAVRLKNDDQEIKCLIIDSLLNSPYRDLTVLEFKALYIDFVMRFEEKQKINKEKSTPFYKVGSEEFKAELQTDPFYNAVRVKYGYAITCHKAQGGEWDIVFVDYLGRNSLKEEPLRWSYTATTRAVTKCYAANTPNVTKFTEFSIGEIQSVKKAAPNALAIDNIPLSPFHNEIQAKCKSMKYWEISKKLLNTPFKIETVQSFGDFRERYSISYDDEIGKFDVIHNGAGLFNDFSSSNNQKKEWHSELLEVLNAPFSMIFNINYRPSSGLLEQLFGLMNSICSDEGIIITNIEEKASNFFVNYYLKTDAKFAMIQFYFNQKGQLTRALPKSMSVGHDNMLENLLVKLKNHVK